MLEIRIVGRARASWGLLVLVLGACVAPDGEHGEHGEQHWSYEGETGPEHWAELDPRWELASRGRQQSPVDLGVAHRGAPESVEFHYLVSGIRIENTGHSVQMNVEPGSWVELHGERYHLKQIHIHSPSERTVDGEHFAMEAHFVHESDDGQLAVVGFLMDAGPASPNFDIFLDNIPGVGEKRVLEGFRTDLARILPDDLQHKYLYTGSLTTPPCTENVEWIVLKSHSTISAEQLAAYREHYFGNNRPIQPLNEREITVD